MLKFAYMMALSSCLMLEGTQVVDEPLSKQPWSQFGPLSQYYVIGRKEKPDGVYEILKSSVDANALILDLGSGTGISTRQLCRNGFKNVIGVDRDLLMIKEARAANNSTCSIKYIQADVSIGLPFPDEQFDVVTASSAFHWFANPSSIGEVARILKPQGYYFIIGSKDHNPAHKKVDVVKENIRHILEEFGVPPKAKKIPTQTVEVLKEHGFKIVVDTTVPFVKVYTKQEYLNYIQSLSSWNLVKEYQRYAVLKKIDHYLDGVVDQQGKIKQERTVPVILAQKVSRP